MSRRHLAKIAAVAWILLTAGGAVAADRFVDNGDGTITDRELGLVWAKSDNQGDIGWKDAARWARFSFPYTVPGGHTDWRLPTLDELRSLYRDTPDYEGYEAGCGQRVRVIPEIELSCGWVWSSEVSAIQARAFSFARGYPLTDRMAHSRGYRALAVRTLR